MDEGKWMVDTKLNLAVVLRDDSKITSAFWRAAAAAAGVRLHRLGLNHETLTYR
jgi:hypothetical protein